MVQRMSPPEAISAMRLSKEVGVSQSQLSRWLRDTRSVVPMAKGRRSDRVVEGGARTAEEKVHIVMEAAALPPGELGAFLRREGVHEAELEQWRAALIDAAKSAFAGGAPKSAARSPEAKRVKDLERGGRSVTHPAGLHPPFGRSNATIPVFTCSGPDVHMAAIPASTSRRLQSCAIHTCASARIRVRRKDALGARLPCRAKIPR